MTRHAEVHHADWIGAPVDLVRRQFADLDHHIAENVHPKLRFEILERGEWRARYAQEVRLLGIRQRDVFERSLEADGRMLDRAVAGFNKGGSIEFRFTPERRDAREGTRVDTLVRLPLPPLIGALLRPLLEAQIRREVVAAAEQDRVDIEQRGYPRRATGAPLAAPAATHA